MTVGKPTDPLVVAEVIKTKLEEPRITYPEFERRGIVAKSTACDIIQKHFGKVGTEDKMLKKISEQDLKNIALGQVLVESEITRRVNSSKSGDKAPIKELAGLMADATKRRQLLTGGATENVAIKIKTYLPEKDD